MDAHDDPRSAAITRISERRDLRTHVIVYCAVNVLLVVIWFAAGGGYFWPIWPIAGWGLAVGLQAWRTLGDRPISDAEIDTEMHRADRSGHRDGR